MERRTAGDAEEADRVIDPGSNGRQPGHRPKAGAKRAPYQQAQAGASLQAFYELAVASGGVLDPDRIARLAVAGACRVLGVDGAILWRWNEELQLLQTVAQKDSRGQEDLVARDRRAGEGLSGETYVRKVPIVAVDYPAWATGLADVALAGVKSGAAAPLLIEGRAVGVLLAYTYGPHYFTPDEVNHLALLAAQLAPTFEAAHHHASLEQEEERLRRAYDAMACGVHVRDHSKKLVFENKAAVRILGHAGPEVLEAEQQGLWSFVDEHGRPLPRSVWPAALAARTGQPQHAEVIGVRRQDERTIWLRLDAVPVLNAAGEVKEVVISFYDVSEEKLAMASLRDSQERLRASEERYRAIVDTAHEGVWLFDAQGRITYANRRMCEITGRSEAELLGNAATELFGATSQQTFQEGMRRRRLGIHDEYEVAFHRKDGTERWTHISSSGVFDESGNLTGVVGMWTDITERKQAERALKVSEERYRTIVETAQEGIWTLDSAGCVTFANSRLAEMLGYSPA
ncbi:MAG: PAS domain S-box protein, partial [Chloroflexota bacterium]|nr:PAS domain S-box protein [Chloroflexota bacterium]